MIRVATRHPESCLNHDSQDERIYRIRGAATLHPENPKIPKILIQTAKGFEGQPCVILKILKSRKS